MNSRNSDIVRAIKSDLTRQERRYQASAAMLAALRAVLKDPGAGALSGETLRAAMAAVRAAE